MNIDCKGLKQKQKKEEIKKIENKPKDKVKVKNEAKELQNLAFGGSKKKNKKKNPANKEKVKAAGDITSKTKDKEESQFEEWKERDKVLENDNFTAALQVRRKCNEFVIKFVRSRRRYYGHSWSTRSTSRW